MNDNPTFPQVFAPGLLNGQVALVTGGGTGIGAPSPSAPT